MGSVYASPPMKTTTIPIDIDNDFGILYWEQDQLQMTLEPSPPWEQARLSAGIWDADGSSGSEYFTQDAILAYGLSDILLADPSPRSRAGPGSGPNNVNYSAGMDGSPIPVDNGTPGRSAREGSRRPARPDITLRSASKKPKKSARRRRPAGTPGEINAREGHNLVEKQYRSRLKAQFEALLAVLPVAQPLDHADHIAAVNPGQCFSRGQVLDAARETILKLENEIEILTAGRDQLMRDLENLERVIHRGPN